MTFHHYTAEAIAPIRLMHPGHFLVEIATQNASCLIAIADTPENRERAIPLMPGMTADLLDSASILSTGAAA
jgi:hypothetical protein